MYVFVVVRLGGNKRREIQLRGQLFSNMYIFTQKIRSPA